MDQIKVMEYLEQNKDFLFPNNEYSELRVEEELAAAPDMFEMTMRSIPFRKPGTVQLIAFLVGSLGVDRFYLGEIGKGVLKYFTFGGLGIWWIKDIFTAKSRCRAYNCKKLIEALNDPSVIDDMAKIDNSISDAANTAKRYAPVAKEVLKGLKDIRDTNFIN